MSAYNRADLPPELDEECNSTTEASADDYPYPSPPNPNSSEPCNESLPVVQKVSTLLSKRFALAYNKAKATNETEPEPVIDDILIPPNDEADPAHNTSEPIGAIVSVNVSDTGEPACMGIPIVDQPSYTSQHGGRSSGQPAAATQDLVRRADKERPSPWDWTGKSPFIPYQYNVSVPTAQDACHLDSLNFATLDPKGNIGEAFGMTCKWADPHLMPKKTSEKFPSHLNKSSNAKDFAYICQSASPDCKDQWFLLSDFNAKTGVKGASNASAALSSTCHSPCCFPGITGADRSSKGDSLPKWFLMVWLGLLGAALMPFLLAGAWYFLRAAKRLKQKMRGQTQPPVTPPVTTPATPSARSRQRAPTANPPREEVVTVEPVAESQAGSRV